MYYENLTLLTDLYELTMMQGYFKNQNRNQTVIFDMFYRTNPLESGYAIAAGLQQLIEYIEDLHFEARDIEYLRSLHIFEDDFLDYLKDFRFSGNIYSIPEGTVIFPREPIVKVIAPIMEAQLVETAILNIINHQSLIATKTARVCYAARGDGIMEFGLRRAQGPDAGIYGARAAMIGGCIGTSNVLAGQMFDVPVKGTHAHSWIMSFPDEYTAFKAYADIYPSACILLVDTYDTLKSGIPNAIRVFTEMREAGVPLTFYGIRMDSGDLAYLSKKVRK
ncbi:MAG: nicotinate phosphoribosyltransferase, partial [Lachnospiraceae bacterium]|nr:nicotinate phosphoribosyltransferase [Lachnospiraceae bacterium]